MTLCVGKYNELPMIKLTEKGRNCLNMLLRITVVKIIETLVNPFGNALEVAFFPKRTEELFGYRLWFKKKHGSRHLYAAGPQVLRSSILLLFHEFQSVKHRIALFTFFFFFFSLLIFLTIFFFKKKLV